MSCTSDNTFKNKQKSLVTSRHATQGSSTLRNTFQDEFELLLQLAHYLAARSAYMATPQLENLVAKVSVSVLRYTHILPADKAFYEAGMACKVGCLWWGLWGTWWGHWEEEGRGGIDERREEEEEGIQED